MWCAFEMTNMGQMKPLRGKWSWACWCELERTTIYRKGRHFTGRGRRDRAEDRRNVWRVRTICGTRDSGKPNPTKNVKSIQVISGQECSVAVVVKLYSMIRGQWHVLTLQKLCIWLDYLNLTETGKISNRYRGSTNGSKLEWYRLLITVPVIDKSIGQECPQCNSSLSLHRSF